MCKTLKLAVNASTLAPRISIPSLKYLSFFNFLQRKKQIKILKKLCLAALTPDSHRMNCLQNLSRSFSTAATCANHKSHQGRNPSLLTLNHLHQLMVNKRVSIRNINIKIKTFSGSTSSAEMSGSGVEEEKSDEYSTNMTQAMGAVLTYRHELGMNYNYILPDLIVGSCLQTPEDVDKLRSIGVKTIFCLQQNSDLEYFSVDIIAIQEYAKKYDDIHHLRAEIRDFDAFDLRLRLPSVLSKLYNAVKCNGGVTYIHCTAGLGRAPAVALAYMFWVQGYKLNEANSLLQSKRSCFPKLDAIKSATADILTGLSKTRVTLRWEGRNCSSVEISGLDIGWGQTVPLNYSKEKGFWILEKELPEGRYEYKYIVDGQWITNKTEPLTKINKDGHINNYVEVFSNDPDSYSQELRDRLANDTGDLTDEERLKIRQFLEAYTDNE